MHIHQDSSSKLLPRKFLIGFVKIFKVIPVVVAWDSDLSTNRSHYYNNSFIIFGLNHLQ